jgi:hypothetical protein
MITVGAAGPVCEPGDGGPTVRQPSERAQLLRHHPQEDHPGMFFHVPCSRQCFGSGSGLDPDPDPGRPKFVPQKGSNEGLSLLKSSLLTGAFL